MKIKLNTVKYIFAYFSVTYILQLVLLNLGYYNRVWRFTDNWQLISIHCLIILIISSIIYKNPLMIIYNFTRNYMSIIANMFIKHKSTIVYLNLLFSLIFFSKNLGNYRYAGSVSENLSLELILTIGLRVPIICFILWQLVIGNYCQQTFLNKKEKFLILIIMLLSLTGVTSSIVLLGTVYIFYLQDKKAYVKYLTVPISLIFLIVIGYSVKWNTTLTEVLSSSQYFLSKNYLTYLVVRLSLTSYSHSNMLFDMNEVYNIYDILSIQFENLVYRLNLILSKPLNLQRPDFQSISRINYLNLIETIPDNSSGVSPGIIPSFIYGFGIILGSLFSAIYINFLSQIMNSIGRFSITFLLLNILLFQSVFKAPLQPLILIDQSVFTFIAFFITYSFISKSELMHKS